MIKWDKIFTKMQQNNIHNWAMSPKIDPLRWDRQVVPEHRWLITNRHCITSQRNKDVIVFIAQFRNFGLLALLKWIKYLFLQRESSALFSWYQVFQRNALFGPVFRKIAVFIMVTDMNTSECLTQISPWHCRYIYMCIYCSNGIIVWPQAFPLSRDKNKDDKFCRANCCHVGVINTYWSSL